MNSLFPLFKIFSEQDILRRFETCDKSDADGFLRTPGKIVHNSLNRRKSGASCHHHNFFSFKILNIEAVSIRPPHQKRIALVMLEYLIGDSSHPADRQIHIILSDAAD